MRFFINLPHKKDPTVYYFYICKSTMKKVNNIAVVVKKNHNIIILSIHKTHTIKVGQIN